MSTALLTFQNGPSRMKPENRRRMVQGHAQRRPVATGWAEGGHLKDEVARFTDYDFIEWKDYGTPTSIRPDVRVTGTREQWAYDATRVGPWGAGPSLLKGANPHSVRLAVPGVEPLWFLNGHLVPSINRRALTKAQRANREKRRRLHRAEIAEMIDLTDGLDRVAIACDWNCRPGHKHIDALRKAGFRIVADSRIDWWAVRGLEVVRSGLLPKNGSDHPGIWIRVR